MTPPVTGKGEGKDHNANTEMEKTSFPALRCSSSRAKRRILTSRVRGSETERGVQGTARPTWGSARTS